MLVTYKWSIEDYHRAIAAGILEDKPVELLEGEIIQMSPEGIPHSFINDNVAEYLRDKFKTLAKVRESHPITLVNSEPEPDIAVVRLPNSIYANHHPYPEDIYWLIEVSNSSLEKDLQEKKRIYALNGIVEYWVIDLRNRKVLVFTNPENNLYIQTKELTVGSIYPLAFPNIEIKIDRLLL